MQDLRGSRIRGYEIEELIGRGGFGAVYKARQTTIGREVAIKVILPNLANHPDFIRRFEAEAQIIARLENMHIVPLYDYWRDPEGAYIVMRWYRGGSLRDAISQNGRFEPVEAAKLLSQIALGLEAAHRNQIIHRDLKPGNILLDEDGNGYLADFGIAKAIGESPNDITDPNQIMGSPGYLAPELARSEPVTPQTDVYSLGIILYELLMGQHPFPDITGIERLFKHLNEPIPEIEDLNPDVRDAINEIIQKATQKKPSSRYLNPMEMAVAFESTVNKKYSPKSMVEMLTAREQEILQLLISGLTNRQIAERLVVTVATVKWYVRQIYKKLGVRSRIQAIVKARELEFVVEAPDDTRIVGSRTSLITSTLDNPYKGLRSFQTADEKNFFGREKVTQNLLRKLQEDRFIAVVGPSGSGKSSLVKAGLIPALWRGSGPGSKNWFVIDMLPDDRPMNKLDVALTRISTKKNLSTFEILHRDENGLLDVVDLILPDDSSELVLIIDQFEEVFTLVADEGQRFHFLNILYKAATARRSRIRIVITLRADFYGRPLQYPKFGELVRDHTETVLPLSAIELEQAITGPAKNVSVSFEEGLVTSIAKEVSYQPGALPLLQYALTELFELREGTKLTHASYQQIGGAIGALAKRAETLFNEFTENEQEITRQIFLRLVTVGDGKEDTRRRTRQSELASISDDPDLLNNILDTFIEYRLLSIDHDPETRSPVIEVAHEAILREWGRLQDWLENSRFDVQMERILASAAQEWEKNDCLPDYLLLGARLAQFENWSEHTDMSLTISETQFVEKSVERRDELEAEKQAQANREARLQISSQKRLQNLVWVATIAAILTSGLALFAMNRQIIAEDARILAVELQQISEQNAQEFKSTALALGAQRALDQNQPPIALALAQEAIAMENPPEVSKEIFRSAGQSSWMVNLFNVSDPDAPDAHYLPDGRRIVAIGGNGRAVIYDRETGEEIESIVLDGQYLERVSVHPSKELIAIGSFSESVFIWNLESGHVKELTVDGVPHSMPWFNSDGTQLITGSPGKIHIWNTTSWTIDRSMDAHPLSDWGPQSIRYNSDESLLVSSAIDEGFAVVWDIESGEPIQKLDLNAPNSEGLFAWVWNAQFLNDDKWIITASEYNVTLWDWRSNEVVWQVETVNLVQDLSLTPDENWFVVALSDGASQLYDVKTGSLIRTYLGQNSRIRNVKVSPNGRYFVSASQSGTVAEWPLWWEGARQISHIPLNEVSTLALHPQGNFIALGSGPTQFSSDHAIVNSFVYILDLGSGEVVQELGPHPGAVGGLEFSPDGQRLLVGDFSDGPENKVFIWDWQKASLEAEFSGHNEWVLALAISPDGKTLVEGEGTVLAKILIRDFKSGEVIGTIDDQRWVWDVKWHPNGESFFVLSDNGLVQRDVFSFEVISDFGMLGSRDIEVFANGNKLAVGGDSNRTYILDGISGEELLVLTPSTSLALHPNENTLATYNSVDGVLVVWDLVTGRELNRYSAFSPDTEAQVSFSRDGEELIVSGRNQVITWQTPSEMIDQEQWIRSNRYSAPFTCEQRELYQIDPECAEVESQ